MPKQHDDWTSAKCNCDSGKNSSLPSSSRPRRGTAQADRNAESVRLRAENKRLQLERDILQTATEYVLCQKIELSYCFIRDHARVYPVERMCGVLEVSVSGYYGWLHRPASLRRQRREALGNEIRAIHAEVKGRYGSPRIYRELVARGTPCCLNTVARIMKELGIAAISQRKFRTCTTDSKHDFPIVPNQLEQEFTTERPNQIWLADITYIPTDEGWLYGPSQIMCNI
jgi:HTH-like domain